MTVVRGGLLFTPLIVLRSSRRFYYEVRHVYLHLPVGEVDAPGL
jgi:hypothetical protein